MLLPGTPAPDFSLPDPEGRLIRLSDFASGWLVLYFYPKDDTPACTEEACSLKASAGDLARAGAAIVGISADSARRHAAFRDKHSLPFVLLSDPGHGAIEAYGAWGEKRMYGRTFLGILRTTYLIDPQGFVRWASPKVHPKEHGAEVLAALVEAQSRLSAPS